MGACASNDAPIMQPLANGSMHFNRMCREWRCKYTGEKEVSASLEACAKVLGEYLPQLKSLPGNVKVNRMVCGPCLDFKLFITMDTAAFKEWQTKGFAPEEEFLAKLKAIEDVSRVETQNYTHMEI